MVVDDSDVGTERSGHRRLCTYEEVDELVRKDCED